MSIGIGGGSKTKTVAPVEKDIKYGWQTMQQPQLQQMAKDIGTGAGFGFGNRNLFGSGIMGEAIARRLGESAVRGSQLRQTNQWMLPGQQKKTDPGFQFGVG